MKVLTLSDTHGISDIPSGNYDLVLLLGDIEFRELKEIDDLFDCPKVGVLGNHDAPDYFNNTSIIDAHNKIVEVNGIKIAGFEGCPKYNRRTYLQYEDIDAFLFTTSIPKVDIFIAHSNPAWEVNLPDNDPHRGFLAFADYIEQKQPKYFLHGHVHKSEEYLVQNTKVISVFSSFEFNF